MSRKNFPILSRKFNGHPMVYFDNAATTQKPREIIAAVNDFYSNHNSNVHRSINPLADEANSIYETARETTRDFLNAPDSRQIIFTRGATEGINLVAQTYGRKFLKSGDGVLLTTSAHHANIIPWLDLKKENNIKVFYIPLLPNFSLDIKKARAIFEKENIKILAFEQASNVTGAIHPARELIKLAHKHGAITLVDAAQSAPHLPIDVQNLNCDFLVFSSHKVFGPTGIGVLYGRKKLLEKMPSWQGGGDMIKEVSLQKYTLADLPFKFEAGTPHIAGAAGLNAALKYIQKTGWHSIQKQEEALTAYFLQKVTNLKYVKIIGPTTANRVPVFTLDIAGVHPHDSADILGEAGIMTRAGHHCAQPLHKMAGLSATLRASLAFYNTTEEIDYFFEKVEGIYKKFR